MAQHRPQIPPSEEPPKTLFDASFELTSARNEGAAEVISVSVRAVDYEYLLLAQTVKDTDPLRKSKQ